MLPVSLIAVGLDARKISPFSLATMTGTVYDSSGVSYIVPTPIISLVFFRGKLYINNFKRRLFDKIRPKVTLLLIDTNITNITIV